MPDDNDEVEVALIRGPGAKRFLEGLGGDEGGGGGEEYDEVEDDDGRVWRSPKQQSGKLRVKSGGKDESFGSKFFGPRKTGS